VEPEPGIHLDPKLFGFGGSGAGFGSGYKNIVKIIICPL
jgi:hypothetical protein